MAQRTCEASMREADDARAYVRGDVRCDDCCDARAADSAIDHHSMPKKNDKLVFV